MTPIPVRSSSLNVAASKFALYQPSGGGDHLAPVLTEVLVLIVHCWAALYSINSSYALYDIRFRGKPGGAILTLFFLNQTVQTCNANSSTLHSKLRTCRSNCGKSWKVIRSLKLHWMSSFHTCASSGQDQSAWNTFSSCCEQKGHNGSSTTQRRCKFFFVGMAFLQALHKKFWTLHGKDNFHIFFPQWS